MYDYGSRYDTFFISRCILIIVLFIPRPFLLNFCPVIPLNSLLVNCSYNVCFLSSIPVELCGKFMVNLCYVQGLILARYFQLYPLSSK